MTRLGAVSVLAVSVFAGWVAPWERGAHDFAPDLPLLAVVMVAAARPREESMLLAVLTGLAAGTFSAAPLGSEAIVLLVLAYLCGRFTGRVFIAAAPVRALLLVGASIAAGSLSSLVAHLLSGVDLSAPVAAFLPRALATAVAGLLVWRAPAAREAVS